MDWALPEGRQALYDLVLSERTFDQVRRELNVSVEEILDGLQERRAYLVELVRHEDRIDEILEQEEKANV